MSELTNLTDRIAHLRERKGDSSVIKGSPAPSKKSSPKSPRERKFAPDSFMLFVYALLAVALIAQVILIVWLDII